MTSVMTIMFIISLCGLLALFARQEYIQDDFENAVLDVEGRLEWATSRNTFPFGMRAQIDVCRERLERAKNLWRANKWQQAYHTALQAQESMNRVQQIYSTVVRAQSRGRTTNGRTTTDA